MEDFVTFNLAKKLKEKGFREKVNAYYGKHENIFDVHPALDMNDADYRASAPTISQVLKWLRKEKEVEVYSKYNRVYKHWTYISRTFNDTCYNSVGGFKSYEQAALAGIEYVIDKWI